MAYQKINWANGEAGNTPLNANNLNKMDNALDDFESRIGDNEYKVGTLETTVAGHTTAINGKMDKNNPVGSGTLEIPKIKVGEVVAYDSDVVLPYVTKYTDSNGSSNKIADKIANIDSSISSIEATDRAQNFKILALQDQKLGNIGNQTLNGNLIIPIDFITEQYETELNGYSIEAPTANFKLDISVLTDSDDAVVNVGSVINTMKSDIQELKDNVGFEITSASPLNGCSASSIVGIDACGNSTQSGTPTPTNPIAIVDASGDVIAHNKNLVYKSLESFYLNSSGVVTSNSTFDMAIAKVESGKTYAITTDDGNYSLFSDEPTSGSADINGQRRWSNTTITIPSGANYIGFLYRKGYATPQIELGTTATDYIAYASNKITLPTLRSVGNVKDELVVNSDGSGQIIKRIGVETINGSTMDFREHSSGRGYALFNVSNNIDISGGASALVGISNMFMGVIQSAWSTTDAFVCTYSATNKGFVAPNRAMSKTDFQTLMNGKSFVFQYILATPTTTTLTASEVSAIRQLQTYSGTTIVDSALDVKSVTYHAGVKEYIDWRFEQLATLMLGEE